LNIKRHLNALRRNLTRKLIQRIGHAHIDKEIDINTKIKRILICRPNHRLGNLLLIIPLIQEVIKIFPGCKIDLFVKGDLASDIFKNYENVNVIIKIPKKPFKNLMSYIKGWTFIKANHYDFAINATQKSFSGRLSVQHSNSNLKFFGNEKTSAQENYTDYTHAAKLPIYNLRNYLTQLGFVQNEGAIAPLDLKLSQDELVEGKEILEKLAGNNGETICLFTYATGEKCYSADWWQSFYKRLKHEYPHYNIVEILPIENISNIGLKAPTFYSNNIRRIASVIAASQIFIGADSGIMHLASAVKTPTVGLFSISDLKVFQPYGNNSIGIDTNISDTDACIKQINKIIKNGSTNGKLHTIG
jgi:ADP-heptose:LPS heptosyltransferase